MTYLPVNRIGGFAFFVCIRLSLSIYLISSHLTYARTSCSALLKLAKFALGLYLLTPTKPGEDQSLFGIRGTVLFWRSAMSALHADRDLSGSSNRLEIFAQRPSSNSFSNGSSVVGDLSSVPRFLLVPDEPLITISRANVEESLPMYWQTSTYA